MNRRNFLLGTIASPAAFIGFPQNSHAFITLAGLQAGLAAAQFTLSIVKMFRNDEQQSNLPILLNAQIELLIAISGKLDAVFDAMSEIRNQIEHLHEDVQKIPEQTFQIFASNESYGLVFRFRDLIKAYNNDLMDGLDHNQAFSNNCATAKQIWADLQGFRFDLHAGDHNWIPVFSNLLYVEMGITSYLAKSKNSRKVALENYIQNLRLCRETAIAELKAARQAKDKNEERLRQRFQRGHDSCWVHDSDTQQTARYCIKDFPGNGVVKGRLSRVDYDYRVAHYDVDEYDAPVFDLINNGYLEGKDKLSLVKAFKLDYDETLFMHNVPKDPGDLRKFCVDVQKSWLLPDGMNAPDTHILLAPNADDPGTELNAESRRARTLLSEYFAEKSCGNSIRDKYNAVISDAANGSAELLLQGQRVIATASLLAAADAAISSAERALELVNNLPVIQPIMNCE